MYAANILLYQNVFNTKLLREVTMSNLKYQKSNNLPKEEKKFQNL